MTSREPERRGEADAGKALAVAALAMFVVTAEAGPINIANRTASYAMGRGELRGRLIGCGEDELRRHGGWCQNLGSVVEPLEIHSAKAEIIPAG